MDNSQFPSAALTGKTALVTGANQGIGWGIARLFAQQGARVVVNYPDEANAPADLGQLGPDALAMQADVAQFADVEKMFSQIRQHLGRLDILVNNAGIFPRCHVLELDEATWDHVLGVNLKGTFFCAQQAARMMIDAGSGRIINISSEAALQSSAVSAHYSASKAGVTALTKAFAMALAPHQIAVNAIAPGITDTAQPRYGMSEDEIVAEGKAVPWGRIAQPEDIARAALYLASDLSAYVAGQTIFVNGGKMMVP